jgi:hypothetical protein
VENGTVTVATLDYLVEHTTQFLKLGEVHQTNQQVSISIKDSFLLRRSELKAFLKLRDDLGCFINFSTVFISGMLISISCQALGCLGMYIIM